MRAAAGVAGTGVGGGSTVGTDVAATEGADGVSATGDAAGARVGAIVDVVEAPESQPIKFKQRMTLTKNRRPY